MTKYIIVLSHSEENPRRLELVLLAIATTAAAQDPGQVTVEATRVAGNVYMITGSGGNIGLSAGDDGALLIDDQYAPLTSRILAAVAGVTPEPVRFVVNTHWHGDHTGGNENLGKAGAIIVAHDNVRRSLSAPQFMSAFNRTVPAASPAALPVITFNDSITFHLNGDEIQVVHVGPAHTDGDAIVRFRRANVMHMGDVYFNGMYPFIDVDRHGSIDGMIEAVDRGLEQADANTKFIPGHGPLSGVAELQAYRSMLRTVRDRVAALVAEGRTRDEVIAAKPTADLDAEWGGGFMKPDVWVGIVYDGMVRAQPPADGPPAGHS